MIRRQINHIILFVLLIFLQVIFFNNIQFSFLIVPYFYVLFVLLLPFETPGWLLLLSSFLLGIIIDLFSNTLGIHAFATTFVAYVRPAILKSFAPRDGYEPGTMPRISYYGFYWFLKYTIVMVLIHHTVLFYIEMFKLTDFFYTLLRVILSTIFTSVFIVISQYFIMRK